MNNATVLTQAEKRKIGREISLQMEELMSAKEVGDKLGMSRQAVENVTNEALYKLSQAIRNELSKMQRPESRRNLRGS